MLNNLGGIITGAAGGIGKAISLLFAKNNAQLAIFWHKISPENILQDLKKLNCEVKDYQVNLEDFNAVQQAIKQTALDFGKINFIINNAGVTADNLILRMKEEEWNKVINVNLKGLFHTTKAVIPIMMKQRDGKIINVSSIVGINGNAGQCNYAAAKAGIIGFSKSIAKEVASRNIKVNVIAPGFIETPMTEKLSAEIKQNLLNSIPLKKLGTPQDVANLALFLCSNLSDYITGQVFIVDGGLTI